MTDLSKLIPLYLEGDALALYLEMSAPDRKDHEIIESKLVKAFTEGAFIAYGKLTKVKWPGESVDAYANNIRRLAGLAGFVGVGAENVVRLAFVHGFPELISIALQQLPHIETKYMSELITAARVLTVNRTDESRGIGAVARSQGANRPEDRKNGKFVGQCFRCRGPHMLRDCRERPKPPVTCYGCGE